MGIQIKRTHLHTYRSENIATFTCAQSGQDTAHFVNSSAHSPWFLFPNPSAKSTLEKKKKMITSNLYKKASENNNCVE